MTTEEAKAVAATATTVGKAIDATSDLGGWVGKVLGTIPEDAVGLLGGDWISEVRTRNAHRLQMRTDEILAQRNAEIEPLSLSVARPLLEAAQDESRDELVEMWARLLANAMDKSRPNIRRSFIETLKKLDQLDVLILDKTYRDSPTNGTPNDDWPKILSATKDEMEISLNHLKEIGCLDPNCRYEIINRQGRPVHMLSTFGRELMRACSE